MKIIKSALRTAAVALFPTRCPYCNKVIHNYEPACPECRRHFPEFSYKSYAIGGYSCAAPFPYTGNYAKAVRRLKFHNHGDLAKPLAAQIVLAVLEIYHDCRFDLITCVPMHKKDLRTRGYNQAELLARECAELMSLPYVNTLEKIKRNQPQHQTSGKERFKNVRGVFRLTDQVSLRGKRVLLIDDIITTGNTLGECARILSKEKCAEINCAVVCVVIENRFIAPE